MKFCFRIFSFLAVSIFLLPVSRSCAQGGVSSSGTDYWLQFMPNGSGSGNSGVFEDLFIASGTDNKVTFSGGVATRTITMTAGQVYDYSCENVMNSTDEAPQDDAIHITSTNPIVVYGYSDWGGPIGGSPDGFLALPTTAYGTKYYTVNFPDNFTFGSIPGEFLITSPYDNNNITITPASVTKAGKPAGVPFTISLSKGQTYLVQSPGTDFGANDLTGSLIQSSRPISVLTGHQISSVPSDYGHSACNLFEMIPSADRWGTQYFDEPMAGRTVSGDYIRVLSAEDGNEITYTGDQSGTHGPLLLNAGEYTDILQQTETMVFTSINNKKFIVAQYSYSQGYPNGTDPGLSDPWMVLFTPKEQFEKSMIFRTPSSLKGAFFNYLTFICLADSISKIVINGQPIGNYTQVGNVVFPGTNPKMGARRIIIAPQPKNYIATGPAPFGAYQYGFSNYEGYGWPTGMAQRLITPDTLPPLSQTLDSNCGSYSLRFTEPRLKPTYSFDDTHIASVSMITEPGDSRWPTPSYNYTFTPDPNFIPGDSVLTATLIVNNHAQDAYAAIYAVDLAGNDTVYQYHYYAPQIAFSPAAPYDFGAVLADGDSCRTITITNVQAAGPFMAESDSLAGIAKGGSFSVTPATLNPIPDSTSISLKVCFHPTDTGVVSVDSVYLISECVTYVVPVTGTGVTPLIYANDLDFGEVDSGQTKCLPLTIENRGKVPLTITAQDLLNNPDFSVNPSQVFPITIPPGKSTTISYCFHPQSWNSFSQRVTFLNLNPAEFQHSIKDTALLTGIALPAGAQLTSYTKDFTVSCNDTTLYDTVFDNLPKDISVTGLELGGKDSTFFSITPLSNSFNLKGNAADSLPFQILFHPTKNGLDLTPRTATLKVITANEGPQPTLTIQAQLVTPIVQIAPNSLDLGTTRVNQTSSAKTFTIANMGNAPLIINSYGLGGPDAGLFTFSPSPSPAYTIPPGGSQVVSVTVEGAQPGSYSATFAINGTCNDSSGIVTASLNNASDVPLGTNHPTTYVGGCRTNTQNASFTNTGTQDSITITALSITGVNSNDFSFGSSFQDTVIAPGKTDSIPIIFLPQATGQRNATLVFSLLGKNSVGADSTWQEAVSLAGKGASVSRQVGIGSVTPIPAFHSMAGSGVSIPVVVSAPIDLNAPDNGTTEAYGYKFNVSWNRDAFRFVPGATTPAGVIVDTPILNKATGMESRLVHFESSTPLTNITTLATLNVQSMLTKSDTTGIVLSNMQWLDKDSIALCYVTDSSFGGTHVLDPVCGNLTLQNFLLTGSIVVDGIRPDPAGSSAEIDYTLASARPISISIYDMLGNEVKRLMDMTPETEGAHTLQFTSDGLSSGAYYCRVTDGHFVMTKEFEIAK